MKVYVAEGGLDYEGIKILGLFNTYDEAFEYCENDNGGYDWYDVEVFEVN